MYPAALEGAMRALRARADLATETVDLESMVVRGDMRYKLSYTMMVQEEGTGTDSAKGTSCGEPADR